MQPFSVLHNEPEYMLPEYVQRNMYASKVEAWTAFEVPAYVQRAFQHKLACFREPCFLCETLREA